MVASREVPIFDPGVPETFANRLPRIERIGLVAVRMSFAVTQDGGGRLALVHKIVWPADTLMDLGLTIQSEAQRGW